MSLKVGGIYWIHYAHTVKRSKITRILQCKNQRVIQFVQEFCKIGPFTSWYGPFELTERELADRLYVETTALLPQVQQ